MKRQLVYGSNTVITIVLVTALLVLINVLPRDLKIVKLFGTRIPLQKQWDLTTNKRFTLSDQTRKVLARLDRPVTAIGFAQEGSAGRTDLEDVLKQYAFHSPNFKYKIYDPVRNKSMAMQYGIKSMRTLVLETTGADGKIIKDTVSLPIAMGDTEMGQLEGKLTGGLLRSLNPKPATVYFTRGHGEALIDDPRGGLMDFKVSLEADNYTVKSIELYNEKQVPDDATVVVITGVQKDFLPDEVQALQKYLARGGRILCFYESSPTRMQPMPNLDRLLLTQGIAAQNDLVLSTWAFPGKNGQRQMLPLSKTYGTSPITEGFTLPTIYPLARSFKVEKPPKDATVSPLALSDPDNTWQLRHPLTGQDQVILIETDDASRIAQPGRDVKGQAILAVTGKYPAVPVNLDLPSTETPSVTIGGSPPPSASSTSTPGSPASGAPTPGHSGSPAAAASGAPSTQPSTAPTGGPASGPSAEVRPKTEARIVVFGSVQMVMGQVFSLMGNGDLVMNSVAWLSERTEQIAVSRPEAKKAEPTLDDKSLRTINWLAIPLLPGLIGVLGLFIVTFNRKH